ncbi:hypothetical protein BDV95DRAFT_674750 [Massariosphaeria phaeospora]|uniref:DUF3074 domain-containing protein n=1 Tax=Massariosphaeria phaeospora TaxID=100035 RepID=A0A7C8IBH6_9PLEO|nr:hypothetical protein BDV95DRAFT_674750 [Massariosphaeria phaeospora]
MSQLHKALESFRPKDFSEVPADELNGFLSDLFSKAELVANSVPPPPNGTPYESSRRSRSDANGATAAADLTVSQARRPPPQPEQAELQKAWGKPVKLGAKESALGVSVFKMAGNDRHGAWFARTSVHEGLGFTKWKRAMMREFPESLEVEGGPGVGNVRGIGGDKRLEDINVKGVGKLEVYQLSAQFPGPTAPREFITLLLTSENCLSGASKVGDAIPRHYMVVSIPVTHPDAPPRNGLVRGYYESVEMIREIPLVEVEDPETNPVEWIMVTRSDPGGGIPRFMVERSTPSSIVADAGRFVDWACSKDIFPPRQEDEQIADDSTRQSLEGEGAFSISASNGILAGVGSSIADRPNLTSFRRPSHRTVDKEVSDAALNPLRRSDSRSSSASSSSLDSFASAEQFTTRDGLPVDSSSTPSPGSNTPRILGKSEELEKIDRKRDKLEGKLDQIRQKQEQETQDGSLKTAKDLEKATEKHNRERKKQEEKFAKEVRKLEARRERETRKLLARQQKEADKNNLLKTQRERDEWKSKAGLAEQENKLLKEQIGELQRENTALVAQMGKHEVGIEILKKVREDMSAKGRHRRGSADSRTSRTSGTKKSDQHEPSAILHEEAYPV